MSKALEQKLGQKRNLEAQWASKLLSNGAVTVEMVQIQKKINEVAQEIKEDSEKKQIFVVLFCNYGIV